MYIKERLKIYTSLLVALMLMIVPIPFHWQWLRPEWISLMLIYWVLKAPHLVGVFTGWVVGLIMDVLGGVLLGQYALAMSVVVYLAHLLRGRLGLFPFWQQAFVILVLVGFGSLILLLVQWLIGQPPKTFFYWTSAITSVLVWPLIYRFLKRYDKKPIE